MEWKREPNVINFFFFYFIYLWWNFYSQLFFVERVHCRHFGENTGVVEYETHNARNQ